MPRNRLSKMRITRVSLVDRPAGIGAEVVLAKRDDSDDIEKKERFFSAESRSEMADKGVAMPDGSFPIPDADALRRAIQSIGRAKDRAAAVRHIKRRAKKLGLEEMVAGLSEDVEKNYIGDGIYIEDRKNNNNTGERDNMSQVHAPHERTTMGTDGVNKGYGKRKNMDMDMEDEDMDMDMEDMEEEMPPKRKKMMKSDDDLDTILKSLPAEAVSYIERLEDIILDMQEAGFSDLSKEDDEDDESDDDVEEEVADEDDSDDEADEEVADDDDDEPVTKFYGGNDTDLESVLKSVDPRLASLMKSYVSKAEQKAAAAEKIAKRERDLRLHREYVAKAADLSALPAKQDDLVMLLTAVADKAPEVEDLLTSVLKAAHGALKESVIFKTEGSDGTDDNTAIAKFDAVVKEIRKSDPALTAEQAFAKALETNPELYDEYLNTNYNKGR